MRLLLIGAPGSGKGTQAERLAERFNITHISSGDLLRQHVRDQTSIGQTIKAYVDAGGPGPGQRGPGHAAQAGCRGGRVRRLCA